VTGRKCFSSVRYGCVLLLVAQEGYETRINSGQVDLSPQCVLDLNIVQYRCFVDGWGSGRAFLFLLVHLCADMLLCSFKNGGAAVRWTNSSSVNCPLSSSINPVASFGSSAIT